MKRIWNVKDREDAARLEEVTARYEGQPNVSIRTFLDLPPFLLPEVLVVNDEGASLSFPQLRDPFGLEACLFFADPLAVGTVREYFDVLWNNARSVVDSGKVVEATARLIRKRAQ